MAVLEACFVPNTYMMILLERRVHKVSYLLNGFPGGAKFARTV